MLSRPGIAAIRFRLSSQIRLRSEPSTSREAIRHRYSFAESVLKGHSKALEEMEKEILTREATRIKYLESNENLLLTCLLPFLESKVISNSRFIPVGSSVTGLASSHSDLDVVIYPLEKKSRDDFIKTIHPNEGLKYELMSVLRSTLVHAIHNWGDSRFEVEDCHILPSLKVPLVICQFTNGTSLDISILDSSFQSVRNTHMMRQYAYIDERVGRLLLWLKTWSSALEIRESKTGLLSSYHLLLLVIHFLQSEQSLSSPVLPILYQTHNDKFNRDIPIEGIVEKLEQPPVKCEWKSKNSMSTAELVIRFFEYYGETNVLTKNIYIDRGMARSRLGPIAEQAAIFDPYSTQPACRSVNALRAFREAVLYTQRRMKNGFMFNPFSPSSDSSFEYFIESTLHLDWRMYAIKKRDKIQKRGLVVNEKLYSRAST